MDSPLYKCATLNNRRKKPDKRLANEKEPLEFSAPLLKEARKRQSKRGLIKRIIEPD